MTAPYIEPNNQMIRIYRKQKSSIHGGGKRYFAHIFSSTEIVKRRSCYIKMLSMQR
jgi:hypothetical protein